MYYGLRRWRPLNDIQGLHIRLRGYRQKSVTAGLGCGLGFMPALFVTTASLGRHM